MNANALHHFMVPDCPLQSIKSKGLHTRYRCSSSGSYYSHSMTVRRNKALVCKGSRRSRNRQQALLVHLEGKGNIYCINIPVSSIEWYLCYFYISISICLSFFHLFQVFCFAVKITKYACDVSCFLR